MGYTVRARDVPSGDIYSSICFINFIVNFRYFKFWKYIKKEKLCNIRDIIIYENF